MPQNTATILSDPKFQGLAPSERIKVLNSVDANFVKLSDPEKMKVVTSPRLTPSSHGATGSWDAPPTGVLDKPWVSPTNPLYPIAEGVREGVTQATNVGQGVTEAVTGIPGMVHAAAKPILQLSHGDIRGAATSTMDLGRGIVQPAVTIGREAGALVAPDSIQMPSLQEQDQASHGVGTLAGGMMLPEILGASGNGASRALSPERMQDLATRLRMVRDNGPNNVHGAVGAATGATVGYKLGGAPGAVVGGAAGGAIGRSAVGATAGAAASVLDRAAQLRLRLGAMPRGATYEPMNPILDATEQARSSAPSQPPIGSTRAESTQFESRFTPEERAAQASDHGAAGPQGEFSKLPNGGPDDPHWQDVNNATMNKSLGINEPEAVTAPVEQPQAEPVAPPQAEPVETDIPPTVQSVADKLVRRGRGAGGADLAIDNAQYLLRILPDIDRLSDVPDASGISPFDKVLTHELEGTGHEIGAKLESVKDKYISTGDAKVELESLMDRAREVGDTTTALKVKKLADLFKDTAIDAGSRVNAIRQGLFKSDLDISTGVGSEVFDIFRGLTEKLDPELVDLNQQYFTLKTSGELAEIRQGGKSPESQVGAGTRPKANFKDRMAANEAATKEAARMEKVKQIREENARKRDAKANDKAANDAKKEALKTKRDAEKAARAKSKEELRRKERMYAAARSSRDRGFRGGPL